MSKRANEVAKELKVSNNELIAIVNRKYPELEIKSHSNAIPGPYLDEVMDYVRSELEKGVLEELKGSVPSPKRANEIAKELGITNNQLLPLINEAFPQLNIKTHSNVVPGENVEEVFVFVRKRLKLSAPKSSPSGTTAKPRPEPVPNKVLPPAATEPAPAEEPQSAVRAQPVKAPPLVKTPPPVKISLPVSSALPARAKPVGPPLRPAPTQQGKPPPPLRTASPAGEGSPSVPPTTTRASSPPPLPRPAPSLPPPLPPRQRPSTPSAAPAAPVVGREMPSSPAQPPANPKSAAAISAERVAAAEAAAKQASSSPSRAPAPPSVGARPPAQPSFGKVHAPLPPRAAPSLPPSLPTRQQPSAPPSLPAAPGAASVVGTPTPPKLTGKSGTTITIRPPIVVRDFAIALSLRPFRLISELMEMGIFASMLQTIEESVAIRIARKHDITLEIRHRGEALQQVKPVQAKPTFDDPKFLEPRPPVVCVLGHVDHGKTTLLDYFRKTNVVSGEAGGITQHVGAYTVVQNSKRITFLDTPGHAAFSKMRERGAEITDIAILVVAADDGFMPQTDEALKFAQKHNVQIVIAINKVDARGANVDRVKQQMQQRGIASEDWGGTVLTTAVSALNGTGMPELLESILLQAEMMELKANPKSAAEGTVVEAQMEVGRGPTSTLIVQEGALKLGDAFVCGQHYCKVRAMFDDRGQRLQSVAPGNPALVLGWSGVPTPGAIFQVCKNEKEAKRLAEENALNLRKALEEEAELVRVEKVAGMSKLSDMDRLMAAIAESKDKIFKVLCKADVNGTLEALIGSLEGIHSTKVKLEVIAQGVGPITPNDVNVAHAGGATIVAFDVKQENGVGSLLKRTGVPVITHNIIYMLIDLVKEAMATLLDPELRENKVGMAEVRAIFPHGKNDFAAGCMVTEGRVQRDYKARIHHKGQIVHAGMIDTLKRFKDDVTEVKAGYECGIRVTGFNNYQVGDFIECYEVLEVRPSL